MNVTFPALTQDKTLCPSPLLRLPPRAVLASRVGLPGFSPRLFCRRELGGTMPSPTLFFLPSLSFDISPPFYPRRLVQPFSFCLWIFESSRLLTTPGFFVFWGSEVVFFSSPLFPLPSRDDLPTVLALFGSLHLVLESSSVSIVPDNLTWVYAVRVPPHLHAKFSAFFTIGKFFLSFMRCP